MIKILFTATMLLVSVGSYAATVTISGGQLVAAQDVNVSGILYDVEFIDGSCSGLFGGCDDAMDFVISAADAQAAAQALLDQVLLESQSPGLDADASLTTGCTSQNTCQIFIPYAIDPNSATTINVARALNSSVELNDAATLTVASRDLDFTSSTQVTYARFTASAVPIPPAVWLFGTGLLGLVGVARRSTK